MSESTQDCEAPAAKKLKLDESSELFDPTKNKGDVLRDKYENFVTPEELEKLKEFQVLDEVKSNDEDSNDDDSYSSDGKSEGLPEEEIEKMLEEDLPEGFKGAPKPKEKAYITRQKIVLEEKGVNHFEVLPLDWMMVRHYSGMPVYVHRTTRVCTLSKPYFLGKGNTRRHDIPISAIPCLAYRRALEEEQKQKEIDKKIEEQIKSGTWTNNRPADNGEGSNTTTVSLSNEAIDKKTTKCDKSEKVKSKCPFRFSSIVSDNGVRSNLNNISDKLDLPETKDNDISKDDNYVVSNAKDDIKESPTNESLNSERATVEIVNIEKLNDVDTNMTNENAIDNELSEQAVKENVAHKTEISEFDGKEEIKDDRSNETATKDENDTKDDPSDENATEGDLANDNKTKGDPPNENSATKDTPMTIEEILKSSTNEQETNVDRVVTNEDVEIPRNRQPVVLPGGIVMPPPRVETVSTSWKTQHLTHEQVNEYCKRLFKFKVVNIMHFMRWADRRKYTKARKTLQYPTLPGGTKLITIPAQPANGQENGSKSTKRDWVMNMNGRSYLSVFHEYVRRALQKQPVYEFVQLENASTPYQATVYIGGMQYGVGHGSSKRQAKSAAARASIHILIPEMKDELDAGTNTSEPDFSFFDYVGIEDPRITEFCAATCEPSPHAILRTCLLRNFGATDRHIHTEMKKLEFQKIELTMKVGKHTATVVCKNKKTAKQRASQAILQALHPHVRSWGSLLRLYGSRSVKSCKEKKLEEQQITLLQDKARHNEPNYAVLEKLRHEMGKLRERDEAVVPIGTLLLQEDLPTHSGANLNNVDL